jgi:hypothetical protein
MKYNVTTVSNNSYDVKVTKNQELFSVDVNRINSLDVKVIKNQELFSVEINAVTINKIDMLDSLSQIEDVDLSNLQDNHVMVYDASTNKYKFIPPAEILDRVDNIDDNSLDFGSY